MSHNDTVAHIERRSGGVVAMNPHRYHVPSRCRSIGHLPKMISDMQSNAHGLCLGTVTRQ
jgi:hypothetical protein